MVFGRLIIAPMIFNGLKTLPAIIRRITPDHIFSWVSHEYCSSHPPVQQTFESAEHNYSDWLRGSGYVMDRMEGLGTVFKKTREEKNILQQRALTHGNTKWESVTATKGLKTRAIPPKAHAQRYLPDLKASTATRMALPQTRNCNRTAYLPAGVQKNIAPISEKRQVHFMIFVSTNTSPAVLPRSSSWGTPR
jgi:hypothetical protein